MNENGKDVRDIIKELALVYDIQKLNGISHIRIMEKKQYTEKGDKILDIYPLAQRWHDVRLIKRGSYTNMVEFINQFFAK